MLFCIFVIYIIKTSNNLLKHFILKIKKGVIINVKNEILKNKNNRDAIDFMKHLT